MGNPFRTSYLWSRDVVGSGQTFFACTKEKRTSYHRAVPSVKLPMGGSLLAMPSVRTCEVSVKGTSTDSVSYITECCK